MKSLFVGKDDQVRGVNLRISGEGKPPFCSRPVPKVLYPLEIPASRMKDGQREAKKKDMQSGMRRDSTEGNEDYEKVGTEIGNERESRYHPKRAAAKDA